MTESERQKASSEYYSELKKQLDELLKKDTELLKISEKIRNNKANFEDTAKYSEIVSNYIAKVIQDNVGNISSPMGKEYVCKELLNSYYFSINDVLGKVQVSVDSKNNIHIRPQQAPVPTERIEQIAHSLEDTTVSEDVIKRRSGSPVANVAKSFHDDFIKKNATFRNKAGLKCYITRHSSGNCCKWCSSIAGKYLYKDAPHDVFRRHDNCNCTVTYENGKQRQNVWSKEKWQVKDISKEKYKPVKLNHEQARTIEQKNLQYKGVKNSLTFSQNSDKIKIPETLANYETAKLSYLKKIKNTEIMIPENRKAVEKTLKTLIDNGDFCMRIEEGTLKTIINSNDKRFKTQMEIGISGGAYNPEVRKKATEILFGADSSKISNFSFEKYGFLTEKDKSITFLNGDADDYGNIIIQFKKENLFNRTTYTVGDSLNNISNKSLILAGKVSEPSVCAVPLDKFTNNIIQASKDFNNNLINNISKFCEKSMVDYIELQYHGELTLNDIEAVYYQDSIDENLKSGLEKLGIKAKKAE